ncbi:hypothetical protein [Acidiferrobacter sp.]|uniref:hypothetical protein n=1 Tax=Acidiferrobacter sp. TaxID=1872107 RepID=UPI00262231D9|nr:hypothetical protein [Acidiferrobacter sp.]
MNTQALAFDEAPPLMLVLRSFLLAPWFLAASGVVLMVAGPGVWADRYTPGLLAATHLVTVGFLTLTVTAAVFQLVPVVAGTALPYATVLMPIIRWGLALGAALLAAAFLYGEASLFALAAIALALAAAVFTVPAVGVLWRLPRQKTMTPMLYAILMLAVALVLGLVLASEHATGAPISMGLLDTHPLWALVGGTFVLWAAVAAQVLPMFQGVHPWPARVSLGLGPLILGLLLATLAADAWADGVIRAVPRIALALVAATAAAHATYRLGTRTRRRADAMTIFWYMGLACLMGAAVVGGLMAAHLVTGLKGPLVFGFLAIAGAAVSLIDGMLYKIVPFLIWLHLQSQPRAPQVLMSSVIGERTIKRHAAIHAAALGLGLAAIGWPRALGEVAGAAWMADGMMLGGNLIMALVFYKRLVRATTDVLPHATL